MGPSVAVVVLDTLRRDVFSRYFEWLPGQSFENAYSTSHWTVPAHASLLTGHYPTELGVHGKSRQFDCPERSVAESLRDEGYTTRLWTANVQIFAWEGWDRGFDHVLGPHDLYPGSEKSVDWLAFRMNDEHTGISKFLSAATHAARGDGKLLPSLRFGYYLYRNAATDGGAGQILQRLERTEFDDEEFLLVNLMETHAPHHPPEPFRSLDEPVRYTIGDAFAGLVDDPDRNRLAYDDSAAYLSSIYRDIFTELRSSFDYVVTVADHGELLGEQGMWSHGYGLYPELVRVPLVVTGEGIDEGETEDAVSLLDIPQTIADLTGVGFDSRGRSVLDDSRPVDRLVEYHGFLPWHRDQLERKGAGDAYEAYDDPLYGLVTASGEYVYQTHDDGLRSPDGPVTDDLEARLDALVSDVPVRETAPDSDDVSSEVREQLENLGYA
jgi:arylsulfatase